MIFILLTVHLKAKRILYQLVTKVCTTRVTHVHAWAILALEIIPFRNYLVGLYWFWFGRTENPVQGHVTAQGNLCQQNLLPSGLFCLFLQIPQTSVPSPSEVHCKLISSHWRNELCLVSSSFCQYPKCKGIKSFSVIQRRYSLSSLSRLSTAMRMFSI